MKIHKLLLMVFFIAIVLAILIFGMLMLCVVIEPYVTIVGSILLGLACTYCMVYGVVCVAGKLADWAWLEK